MKKPLKVLSSAALATVFTASTLVPVAAAEAKVPVEATQLEDITLKTEDGKLAYISYEEYAEALTAKIVSVKGITHIGAADGSRYSYEDFSEALSAAKNVEKALELLYKSGSQDNDAEIYEGFFDEDNKLQAKVDEQPEDRLNETFFYNVA